MATLAAPTPTQQASVVDALVPLVEAAAGPVALYVALPGEVDVERLRTAAAEPVLSRLAAGAVSWHRADGALERHPYGFDQPMAGAPEVAPDELRLVLVPGLAFDRSGIRLGRGGGHYDRLVPALSPGTPVVGVTVSARVFDELPREDHDAPMTHLATEAGVLPVA